MKLLKLIPVFILLLFLSSASHAQVQVNVNIGTAPTWGPPITNEDYYFLPDIETYYDIRTSQYIYMNNGRWIRVNNLPSRYRNYNLNGAQIIILSDYHGRSPYVNFHNHKIKYMKKNKHWDHDNGDNGHHGEKGHGKYKNKGNGKNK